MQCLVTVCFGHQCQVMELQQRWPLFKHLQDSLPVFLRIRLAEISSRQRTLSTAVAAALQSIAKSHIRIEIHHSASAAEQAAHREYETWPVKD